MCVHAPGAAAAVACRLATIKAMMVEEEGGFQWKCAKLDLLAGPGSYQLGGFPANLPSWHGFILNLLWLHSSFPALSPN